MMMQHEQEASFAQQLRDQQMHQQWLVCERERERGRGRERGRDRESMYALDVFMYVCMYVSMYTHTRKHMYVMCIGDVHAPADTLRERERERDLTLAATLRERERERERDLTLAATQQAPLYVCMYLCVYVCMHVCVYACTHTRTQTHVCYVYRRRTCTSRYSGSNSRLR